MTYITRNLRQNVTYWSPGGNDGFGGVSYAAPVTIKGRWQDIAVLFRDTMGNEVVSQSKVWIDTDVVNKGYLFLGVSTGADPETVSGAYEIRHFGKIPNLRATEFERLVFL